MNTILITQNTAKLVVRKEKNASKEEEDVFIFHMIFFIFFLSEKTIWK
jgi:hypothetical protein